ncbi:MAG: hypothetical protein MI867_12405 [Pseudomonadales bacterium]|nr:hypothetical protein [Pseudomonadales bacterium]
MAQQILKDQTLYFDTYELTSTVNAMALEYGVDAVDDTMFGDDTRSAIGGLKNVNVNFQGGVDYSAQSSVLFDKVGVQDTVLSFGAAGATEGDRGYLMPVTTGLYEPGGNIGDLYSFTVNAQGSGNLVAGNILGTGTKNNTGNSAGYQLGAVSATQRVYGALHVLSASGTTPTLDVTLESNATGSFSGSQTTRLTFTQVTTSTSAELISSAGAITDTWWRVVWTIGGTTPVYAIRVVIGII